ncbi:2TM domain-containing protein [Chryseobacterium sp. SSA4.19]|uniref:2TM domain-containing protein n=1 Tax=Chryseobacterium sp. SSA4.19 TaxID=2919915 RepID=UPI001F4DE259|nr:2TM domain-containing protein [Chryseobacterium sp. SSA4.19]MCJ8152843.1 2TM domain-containing protein [Chryseobacterium sp. SSA4.19]
MENISKNDIRYKEAEKQVKRIKQFYIFVFIYIVVNIFILFLNFRELKPGETIWQLKYFSLPLFWGIAVVIHAMRTFIQGFMLGSNWEDRKIREFMEKEKQK